MKAVLFAVVATLALAAAGPARADDQTKFAALVRKSAPNLLDQYQAFAPRTLCVCDPGGARAAGVLLSVGGTIGCLVPNFQNGALASLSPCATYLIVGK